MNSRFYDVVDIAPSLRDIEQMYVDIRSETQTVLDAGEWIDWRETGSRGHVSGIWSVFPLYCFNFWCEKNCSMLPKLTAFIKSINHVRLASLSKLRPRSRTARHSGWARHSNHVLRCHYGIIVPFDSCFISVRDDIEEIKYQHDNVWTVFDDAKEHYAFNTSDYDRVVLIVDIERPSHVLPGTSTNNNKW